MKKLLATLAFGLAALPLYSGITTAHGCHRDIQLDGRGWHRHAQNDCDRINVDRGDRDDRENRRRRYREERHEPYCIIKCKYVGPFKQCRKECDYN